MIRIVRVRLRQGYQAIRDLRRAVVNPKHRGFPLIDAAGCGDGCADCAAVCPTGAIAAAAGSLSIDLGRCVFCGDCERACRSGAIRFSPGYKLAATGREALVARPGQSEESYRVAAMRARADLKKLFGRSLKIRQVSAGGCGGCEMELNACSNVNFDMGRFGIEVVASPRHADCLLITGPITANMAAALNDAWEGMPGPKLLALAGACAISGGVFDGSPAVDRSFLAGRSPDLYIPGCPVHPLTVVNAFLDLLGAKSR